MFESLQARGVQTFLVSGGFREVRTARPSTHWGARPAHPGIAQLIHPVAAALGVDERTHVFANTLVFHEDGGFAGFDAAEPTSRAGGKAVVVQRCAVAPLALAAGSARASRSRAGLHAGSKTAASTQWW